MNTQQTPLPEASLPPNTFLHIQAKERVIF